jgi:hypothetical protein
MKIPLGGPFAGVIQGDYDPFSTCLLWRRSTLVSRHVEIALALVLITIFSLYALERLQRRPGDMADSHVW